MSNATSLRRATQQNETERVRARSRNTAQETPENDIKTNAFYQIVFNPQMTPEAKLESAAQALTFTENKEQNRSRLKEFESFKEYLHAVSEAMSKERIKLTDTEVFAELQRTYGMLNDDLEDFFNKIRPLTDITDALYKLRSDGKTRDVLSQIREDRDWEATFNEKRQQIDALIASHRAQIDSLERENIHLAQQKGFFGFGQIKGGAMAQIKINEGEVEKLRDKISELNSDVEKLRDENKTRKADRPDSFEMQKLRELLDLTSEEHVERQAGMVGSALKFVESGKERFGAIRGHLDKMVNQIEGLGDNNAHMTQITAIMNEATKKAEEVNQKKREDYTQIPEGANLVEKMKFETLRQDIEEHIDVLSTTSVDTMQSYAELTTEAIKIRNMQAATKKQVESARSMHSRGISSVASQLSTVLTAVNAAGINEAQAMAANTLTEMARVTNDIAQKEAIRIATSRDDINVDLEEQLKTLMDFGDNQRQATEITRSALENMRKNLAELKDIAEEVQDDTREFVGVTATVIENDMGSETKKKPAADAAVGPVSPFSIIKENEA